VVFNLILDHQDYMYSDFIPVFENTDEYFNVGTYAR